MQIRQILQVFLQMSAQTAAAPAAHPVRICCGSCCCLTSYGRINSFRAIPHNPKCRYGEQGTADAKPKAQIILDAAKVSAASGGNSEPKQGQRSQSARGFCPQSTMRVPQPDIIEHFGNADAVPQPPERCLSRKAGIVRCWLRRFPIEDKIKGIALLLFGILLSCAQDGLNDTIFASMSDIPFAFVGLCVGIAGLCLVFGKSKDK